MRTKVFHADTSNDRDFRLLLDCYRGDKLKEIVLENMDKYNLVATPLRTEVHGNKILEEAYRLTNSIDYSWYEDEDARATETAKQGCRSTSIGDIVEFAGVKYVVDSYGFTCLEND